MIALAVIAVLFWAAVSHRVYWRTLPMGLIERVFGEDSAGGGVAVHTVLRKLYSIVAFAIIGFVVDRALPRSSRPALRAAIIVAAFSLAIEVAQKLRYAREGLGSEAFDVACGALGGWLAIALQRLFRRHPEKPR